MYTEDRAFNVFASQRVDVTVFGHSHQPMNTKRDGILMFNPGSAVAGRGGQGKTYGVFAVGEAVGLKNVRVSLFFSLFPPLKKFLFYQYNPPPPPPPNSRPIFK